MADYKHYTEYLNRVAQYEQHGAKATLSFDQWLGCMGYEKEEIPEEPQERYLYRIGCKHYGMEGICFKHSGYLNETTHITLQCDGDCPRMKRYDKKKGNNEN